jgi:phage shock protein B
MEDAIIVAIVIIGLPWLIMHYITKWKSAGSLTTSDENLLDDLHDMARRLSDRVETMERIVKLDNPEWKPAPRYDDDYALDAPKQDLRTPISDRRN